MYNLFNWTPGFVSDDFQNLVNFFLVDNFVAPTATILSYSDYKQTNKRGLERPLQLFVTETIINLLEALWSGASDTFRHFCSTFGVNSA